MSGGMMPSETPISMDLRDLLRRVSITASAPGRIDCGGTWDIKALALAQERIQPVTVNIAINLRTTVRLYPYDSGKVAIHSQGFDDEEAPVDTLPFHTPL